MGVFSLKKSLRGGVMDVYKYMMGGNEEERDRLSSVVPSDRTRDTGHNIQTCEITSECIVCHEGGHWNWLLRKVVESSLVEVLQTGLDVALGILL